MERHTYRADTNLRSRSRRGTALSTCLLPRPSGGGGPAALPTAARFRRSVSPAVKLVTGSKSNDQRLTIMGARCATPSGLQMLNLQRAGR